MLAMPVGLVELVTSHSQICLAEQGEGGRTWGRGHQARALSRGRRAGFGFRVLLRQGSPVRGVGTSGEASGDLHPEVAGR